MKNLLEFTDLDGDGLALTQNDFALGDRSVSLQVQMNDRLAVVDVSPANGHALIRALVDCFGEPPALPTLDEILLDLKPGTVFVDQYGDTIMRRESGPGERPFYSPQGALTLAQTLHRLGPRFEETRDPHVAWVPMPAAGEVSTDA